MTKRPKTMQELIALCGSTALSEKCFTAQSVISGWSKKGLPHHEHRGVTNRWEKIAEIAENLGHKFTRDQIMSLSNKAKEQSAKSI